MIYDVIVIFCSIFLNMIVIRKPIIRLLKKEKINIKEEYKHEFILYILLVIGCLVRSFGIHTFPRGLNVDEASSAYEAFSILNFGIDRNGNSFPVFIEAWGSGQSALYTYLMIPFVKVLGLNLISTRLPMILVGCLSLIVWYKLLTKIKNKEFALIGLAFLVICPWHIMKSRWGIDCNFFPDITLYAVFFIVKYLESKKERYFYIGSVLLGLTAYTYGTSYFFLPVFFISLLIYLRYKNEIKTSKIFIGIAIVGIVSLPIILYVLINTFNLQEIALGPFTIPKLPVNRYEEQTSLFSSEKILSNLANNFMDSLKLLLTQDDRLIWNGIPGYGMIYNISLPFVILGILYNRKEKNNYHYVFEIWFIAAFLLLFILNDPNINRINILIIPLIYYAVNGIYFCIERVKNILPIICIIYLTLFMLFGIEYTSVEDNGGVFITDIENVIKYVDELDVQNIYFEYAFKEPYISVLYYTEYDTRDFIKTVRYFSMENFGRFENISGFGKYNFYLPNEFKDTENTAYVVKKQNNHNIDYTKFEIKEFNKFIVLYKD